MLSRMEKSLAREAGVSQAELARLPQPAELLRRAEGPAELLPRPPPRPLHRQHTLLVIARQHSGYPVLGQFLTTETGWWESGEPAPPSLPATSDLLSCVLTPGLVAAFPASLSPGSSFPTACLLAAGADCSDPLSYEQLCWARPRLVLRTRHTSLASARSLLAAHPGLVVVYLARDPRGAVREAARAAQLCSELAADLTTAASLAQEFPGRFTLSRYEELAVRPRQAVTQLLAGLGLGQDTVAGGRADSDWSAESNPVSRVDRWRGRLTSKQLQVVETACLEPLSRLEYQLLGRGVA